MMPKMNRAYLYAANLANTILQGAQLFAATLTNVSFVNADLRDIQSYPTDFADITVAALTNIVIDMPTAAHLELLVSHPNFS